LWVQQKKKKKKKSNEKFSERDYERGINGDGSDEGTVWKGESVKIF